MAKPRTALGTAGRTTVAPQVQNSDGRWVKARVGQQGDRYRARTRFRDADGVLRDVERYARTRARAETKLREALRDRRTPVSNGHLRPDTSIVAAGDVWLAQVRRPDSGLSDGTRVQYAGAFDRWVRGSSIAGLTLREVNRVAVLEAFLRAVADTHGTGAAKTTRSVVSSILGLAVRYGVLDFNATREVRPAKATIVKLTQRDTTRALTRAERDHVLTVASNHKRANDLDYSDLVWFMAGTGVRISEGLAVLWDDVDLEKGTVLIRGTKSAAAFRLLSLPVWLTDRLTERARVDQVEGLVFASPRIHDNMRQRNLRNATRVFREIFDEAGFPWATSHTLRRTVATLIGEAGLPLVAAADQLGHKNPSMTASVYLGRKGDLTAAGAVL